MVSTKNKDKESVLSSTILSVLLAASAQSSCPALACSCHAPSRDFSKECEESSRTNHNRKGPPAEKRDGVKGEVDYSESQGQENSNGHSGPHALKSNLKKTTEPEENKLKTAGRKVSWPDAHGKDIARVHEFESSMSEEGELEGVRNSCICAIQ